MLLGLVPSRSAYCSLAWLNRYCKCHSAAHSENLPSETPHTDLGSILKRFAELGAECRIKICKGVLDLTRWQRVRARFGASIMNVQLRDGARESTVLGRWRWDKRVQLEI